MEPRPIRMPDDLWEAIEADAKEHNRMAAEHVREICREYLEAETKNIRKQIDELQARVADLEDLERRVERLEEQRTRQPARTETAEPTTTEKTAATTEAETTSETETATETETLESPEPIETIDDVLQKARIEHGTNEQMLVAGKAALNALREAGRVPKDELRDRLAEEVAPSDASTEVWWSKTVQPVFEIAAKWGLVVVHEDELEWIGPPESGAGR